jgi:DNA-binding transcriptional LysR family regulator
MNDLRQLRHFVALAEYGHFARAAEAVNLSQPALSRSIQALEASLGCSLLDRGPRQINLTAHGRLVLEHARRLLDGNRALRSAVTQLDNLDSGELRLGAGPYPAARLVPRALGRFASNHPGVQVQLSIENWHSLRQRLLDDAIELFVADVRELEGDPLLDIIPLRRHAGTLFCRPGHPLLERGPLAISDLADYALAGTQLPAEVASAIGELSGNAKALGIECDNFMVLKALVAESDVISMAPWDVVADDVANGRLAVLEPLRSSRTSSAYGVVSHAARSLSPAARAMRELLLEEDRDFPAV